MITLSSAVGIDVRGDDLALVCLKKGLRTTSLAGYTVIEGFRQVPHPELRRLIKKFFGENGVKGERVVLGIPRDEAVVRFISLPLEVKENLDQVVRFQVENFEPSEENGSYYYDFKILKQREGEGAKLTVALVLVKKDSLDEYLALLGELQIPLHAVQISTVALWNLLLHGHEDLKADEATFIFNFSKGRSELVGVEGKYLTYSSLHRLNESVPSPAELLADLENALSASRIRAEKVERIYLAGQEADSLAQHLATEIPEVRLMTSRMKVRADLGSNPSLAGLAAPIGLALEGLKPSKLMSLNLLPEQQRARHSRLGWVVSSVLLAILSISVLGYFGREYYQERVYLQELEDEIEALKPRVKEVDSIRGETQVLEGKIAYLQQLFCVQDNTLELLDEMTRLTPDDTYLLYFTNRRGDVMFQGLSKSASALLPIYGGSEYLKGVEPQAPFTRDPVSGRERFALKAHIERQLCK